MSSTTSSTKKNSKKFTNALDAKAQMGQITGGLSGSFETFHIAGKETKQGRHQLRLLLPVLIPAFMRCHIHRLPLPTPPSPPPEDMPGMHNMLSIALVKCADLRVDDEGLAEIDNELYKLNKRKVVLEARIASGTAWIVRPQLQSARFCTHHYWSYPPIPCPKASSMAPDDDCSG